MRLRSLWLAILAAWLPATAAVADLQVGFVYSDDGPLFYEIEGKGPPVVLLHSAFMDLHMWDGTARALARSRTVIRYDARGHGRSPFPSRPVAYYEDLHLLLDKLHVAKADLIGASLGGVIACDFAIAYPDRVRRIVLAGAAPNTDTGDPEEGRRMGEMIVAARKNGVAAGVEKWLALPMNASATGAAREAIRRVALESPDMFALKFWPVKNLEPPAMTRLAQLRAPVLIVSGTHDSPSLRADAGKAARGLPDARFESFANSGHFPNLEEPEHFVRVVRAFLDEKRSTPGQ
jgi:pimeloyl-ACP methyl ester carboxylesterase